jgi:hypothetical protein
VKKKVEVDRSPLERLSSFVPPPFKLTVMHIEGVGTACRMCSRRQSLAVPLVLILCPLNDGCGFQTKIESALCFDCYNRLREAMEADTLPSLVHLKLQGRYAEGAVSFDAKDPRGEAKRINQMIQKMYKREDPFIVVRQDFPLASNEGSPNIVKNPVNGVEE